AGRLAGAPARAGRPRARRHPHRHWPRGTASTSHTAADATFGARARSAPEPSARRRRSRRGRGRVMLLAADVGGTNARVALFERGDSKPRVVEKYRTAAWDGVPSLLAEFVATHPVPLTGACVAVAGPVEDGRADVISLPWPVEADRIARARCAYPRSRSSTTSKRTPASSPCSGRTTSFR